MSKVAPSTVRWAILSARGTPVFVAGSVLLAVLGYLAWGSAAEAGSSNDLRQDAPTGPLGASDDSQGVSASLKVTDARARVTGDEARSETTITIVATDPSGSRADGTVLFQATRDPLNLGAMLGSRIGGPLVAGPRYGSEPLVQGRARINRLDAEWLWLCVAKPAPSPVCRYLLVPPGGGEVEHHVELDGGLRRLHIFLLSYDLERPEQHDIDVYLRDTRVGGPAARMATLATNEVGYASVELARSGLVIVVPHGVPPAAGHPVSAKLVLDEHAPTTEHVVKLAMSVPLEQGEFKVLATLSPTRLDPVVLYLKNLNPYGDPFYPVLAAVGNGKQTLPFRVPAGTYELGSVPLGIFGDTLASKIVNVVPHARNSVVLQLVETKKHCVLDLGGLPRGAFPVTIRPRESKELFDMPGQGLFLGVFRCRTSRLPVAAQDRTCRLNVIGRGQHFVSQNTVDLSAKKQVVELRPASLVRVRIEGQARINWSDIVLLCESRLGREQARLRRGLWNNGRWTSVFRYASALFPQGTVSFRLWDRGAGRVLAEQSLECRKAAETITLVQ